MNKVVLWFILIFMTNLDFLGYLIYLGWKGKFVKGLNLQCRLRTTFRKFWILPPPPLDDPSATPLSPGLSLRIFLQCTFYFHISIKWTKRGRG